MGIKSSNERALLARLALEPATVVRADSLIEAIWPEGERPNDPARALRYHVWHVHDLLEPYRADRSEGTLVLTASGDRPLVPLIPSTRLVATEQQNGLPSRYDSFLVMSQAHVEETPAVSNCRSALSAWPVRDREIERALRVYEQSRSIVELDQQLRWPVALHKSHLQPSEHLAGFARFA